MFKILCLLSFILSAVTQPVYAMWQAQPAPRFQPSPYQRSFSHQSPVTQGFGVPFNSSTVGSSCSFLSCGTLHGFKGCLASPQSVYRFYAHNRHRANTPKARDARMRFIYAFPACFKRFCRNVCADYQSPKRKSRSQKQRGRSVSLDDENSASYASESRSRSSSRSRSASRSGSGSASLSEGSLSESSEEGDSSSGFENSKTEETTIVPDEDEFNEESSNSEESQPGWLRRKYKSFQKYRKDPKRGAWFRKKYKNFKRYQARRNKASVDRISGLCHENSDEGFELRSFCSECRSYLGTHQRLNPLCQLTSRDKRQMQQGSRPYKRSTRQPKQRRSSHSYGSYDRSSGSYGYGGSDSYGGSRNYRKNYRSRGARYASHQPRQRHGNRASRSARGMVNSASLGDIPAKEKFWSYKPEKPGRFPVNSRSGSSQSTSSRSTGSGSEFNARSTASQGSEGSLGPSSEKGAFSGNTSDEVSSALSFWQKSDVGE